MIPLWINHYNVVIAMRLLIDTVSFPLESWTLAYTLAGMYTGVVTGGALYIHIKICSPQASEADIAGTK